MRFSHLTNYQRNFCLRYILNAIRSFPNDVKVVIIKYYNLLKMRLDHSKSQVDRKVGIPFISPQTTIELKQVKPLVSHKMKFKLKIIIYKYSNINELWMRGLS